MLLLGPNEENEEDAADQYWQQVDGHREEGEVGLDIAGHMDEKALLGPSVGTGNDDEAGDEYSKKRKETGKEKQSLKKSKFPETEFFLIS